jgi:hypothetical protein
MAIKIVNNSTTFGNDSGYFYGMRHEGTSWKPVSKKEKYSLLMIEDSELLPDLELHLKANAESRYETLNIINQIKPYIYLGGPAPYNDYIIADHKIITSCGVKAPWTDLEVVIFIENDGCEIVLDRVLAAKILDENNISDEFIRDNSRSREHIALQIIIKKIILGHISNFNINPAEELTIKKRIDELKRQVEFTNTVISELEKFL